MLLLNVNVTSKVTQALDSCPGSIILTTSMQWGMERDCPGFVSMHALTQFTVSLFVQVDVRRPA